MTQLTSICVYCGSNSGTDPAFAAAAAELGQTMAKSSVRLVYGGGSVGLMGIVARAVMDNGGNVTGIIPQFLKDREVMLKEVPDLVVTTDMHERKRIMFEKSDAFLALPGGIGTLEEVVEIMTWAQLGRHAKPILIANINGFWEPLIGLFRQMTNAGFLGKAFLGDHPALPVHFVTTIGDVIPTIEKALAGVQRTELEKADPAKVM